MASPHDYDPFLLKCIGYMHTAKDLRRGDTFPLQHVLEEAIKNKYGITKDYTNLIQSLLPPREEEVPVATTSYDDAKASNSDELELDLFKDDLMCVVCNGMDVGARNRLLECSGCHSLYHQECHQPEVTMEDSFENWVCKNCKEAADTGKITAPSGGRDSVPVMNPVASGSGSSSHAHKSSKSASASSSSSAGSSSSYRHSHSAAGSSGESYKSHGYSRSHSHDKYK